MAIAGENVKFSSAYTAAGLTPDGSSTFHLPRSIGKKRTMELMLTNRVLSSKEALDWGLINKVVNDEDVISETNKLAMKIAKGPTKAFGGVKEMLRQSFSNGLETQMELESQIFSEQLKGVDGPEGIEAFTSKRKPEFKGK
jgi:2-(1,2-epoxy-1,2-dihydrophenyl)acetyl-CoA isomerase